MSKEIGVMKKDNLVIGRILVVDDDDDTRELLKNELGKEGYRVKVASSGEEAIHLIEGEQFDLVISDLKLPAMNDLRLLKRVKELCPKSLFIVLAEFGTVTSAVVAMKEGAFDYLIKSVNMDEVTLGVKKALDSYRLIFEVESLKGNFKSDIGIPFFQEIIGESPKIQALFMLMNRIINSQATVLVTGESGTGKELVARAIHYNSRRKSRPFVTINCNALTETLLESELFGHVRGSFTGAITNKKGLFEEANGGTLFLDEIGDTTLAFQSKLLRALQEGEIRPIGGNKSIKIDVHVIAATNKDLMEMVKKKNFREDLYYRLAVIVLDVPPLRERREDIPQLVVHFIKKYCEINHVPPKVLSPQVINFLVDHPWPGNIRELANVIERAVLINQGPKIELKTLLQDQSINDEKLESLPESTRYMVKKMERERIAVAIRKAFGNRSRAAKLLGVSRATLYNKMKEQRLALESHPSDNGF